MIAAKEAPRWNRVPAGPPGTARRLKLPMTPVDGRSVTSLPAIGDSRDGLGNRLRALMQDFDRNGMEKRQQIRDLLDAGSENFYRAAIEILKEPAASRGEQIPGGSPDQLMAFFSAPCATPCSARNRLWNWLAVRFG